MVPSQLHYEMLHLGTERSWQLSNRGLCTRDQSSSRKSIIVSNYMYSRTHMCTCISKQRVQRSQLNRDLIIMNNTTGTAVQGQVQLHGLSHQSKQLNLPFRLSLLSLYLPIDLLCGHVIIDVCKKMQTLYIQSNLVSEYTWGPSKLLLTISSTC